MNPKKILQRGARNMAEFRVLLRELARLGFLEVDEVNDTSRLHPQWHGHSWDDIEAAMAVALGDVHAH
jgi:hypothetical protein